MNSPRRTTRRSVRTLLHLLLPIALLGAASSVAAQIFPELPLSALDSGNTPGVSLGLSIASDGDGFLAAWSDARSDYACFATRIDRDGTVLDLFGIRLPLCGALSFDDSNYVVFDRLSASRVGSDGRILDPRPRRVVPEGEIGFGHASAAGRSAVIHRRGDTDWFVSIVDRELEPIHAPIKLNADDIGFRYVIPYVRATTDGKFIAFLVPDWPECPAGCPMFAYLIDPATGSVTRRLTLASSPDVAGETIHSFAVGPSGFVSASLSYGLGTIVARSWDFDGAEQASSVLYRETAHAPQFQPDIIADGSGYVVSFETHAAGLITNQTAKLDTRGRWNGTLASVSFDDGLPYRQQRLGWNGSRYLVSYWRSEPDAQRNHYVAVSDRPDEGRNLAPVSASPSPKQAIALASSGGVRLALWSTGTYYTGFNLRATRFSEELRPIEPEGIAVADGISAYNGDIGVRAAVAPIEGGFLIAWQGDSLIFARRLSVTGVWIDPEPRRIDENVCSFTSKGLTESGPGLAIVYSTCDPLNEIVFRRIEPGAMTIGPAVTVGPPIVEVSNPMIAGDGETHLVVWQYAENYQCPVLCPLPDPQLRAERVTREGQAIGSSFDLTSIDGGGWFPPAIEWTGSNYLVVWYHNGLRGVRVSPEGSILDSSDGDVLAYDADNVQPSLQFDGRRVELLWTETVPDASEERLKILSIDPTRPLAGQRLEGELGWLAVGLPRRYQRPRSAMMATGTGRLMLLYSRVPPELEAGGTSRVFFRELVTGGSRRAVRR